MQVGFDCLDINECVNGTHECDMNANCTNIDGGHNCTCLEGFYGTGDVCIDSDECALLTDAPGEGKRLPIFPCYTVILYITCE